MGAPRLQTTHSKTHRGKMYILTTLNRFFFLFNLYLPGEVMFSKVAAVRLTITFTIPDKIVVTR